MKGEWCYFNKWFSKQECDKILELGLQLPVKDATLGVEGKVTDNNFRKSKIRFINPQHLHFQFLFDKIWKMGIQANAEWFNFHMTKLPYIQLAEYDAAYKGEYKKHQDVFWITKDNFHRKLSCVIQLTDPSEYEGGELELFGLSEYPKKEELKNQGTALFFPSFVLHQAHPVTKGKRYSLAVWFEGNKWV